MGGIRIIISYAFSLKPLLLIGGQKSLATLTIVLNTFILPESFPFLAAKVVVMRFAEPAFTSFAGRPLV